ncbi:MAG TPA: hypothetical protein VFX20_11150 [Steroidobacteraceae bacterium]|nr:hypothetical protein [Steroidobacteraceae bacterium]
MQCATDAGRWRASLVDSNVRVLVWLTAALVMGILALNVWLISQAIAAARIVQFDATGRSAGPSAVQRGATNP